MRKWLGTAWVLFVLMTIQACAPKSQKDCGFVQNVYGERISWKSDVPVTMYLHSSVPEALVQPILNAAATWERTAGRRLFNIVTSPREMGPMNPHRDGRNVIYFMNTWESNLAAEQGRTSVYWIGDLIKEADIRLNAYDFSFYWKSDTLTHALNTQRRSSAAVNIEALVLHEMGHVLGLKHKDGAGSVMATYLAGGDDRVILADADTVNLQCEY